MIQNHKSNIIYTLIDFVNKSQNFIAVLTGLGVCSEMYFMAVNT